MNDAVLPKTWAASKTQAEWRDRIIKTLGGSAWNVELDEPTIDHAIWQTLSLFNKYRPEWKWKPLGLISGNTHFDFSKEELGTRVVDVKFQNANNQYSRPFHYPFKDQYPGIREPRRVFQLLQAEDRYNSFLGTQPSWKWEEEKRILFICCLTNNSILATALFLVPLNIDKISFTLETDFLQGAVGYSKLILARILGKYGGIPASQGTISLDGDRLRSEGEKAIEDLEKKLDRNLRHMPPKPIF